jgi:hypothetical protein
MEVDVLATILPVLGLRILFDALADGAGFACDAAHAVPIHRAAVASGQCGGGGPVRVAGAGGLRALGAGPVADRQCLRGDGGILSRRALAAGAGLSATALSELGFFGLYAMGGRILSQARLDHLVLGVVLGPATLGLYYFAQGCSRMLGDLTSGVFGPVTNVLMASLQAEPDKRRKAFQLASFASAGLAFPVFGGLIVLALWPCRSSSGPQWIDAVYALQCLSVMGMLAVSGVVQAALIRNLGRPDWWFWYQTATKASALVLIVALAPLGLDA